MISVSCGRTTTPRYRHVGVTSIIPLMLACAAPQPDARAGDTGVAAGVAAEACPAPVPEVWVERRYPAARSASAASATLSIALAPGLDSAPPRTMISVVIAGPDRAELPDTIRLLASEAPDRAPLWQGSRRPGEYTANLTMQGFRAGPHRFTLAPGERVEVEVSMGSTADCRAAGKPPRPGDTTP